MPTTLRTLLPPGGFSNLVGQHVAAMDIGSAYAAQSARAAANAGRAQAACAVLGALGELESRWIHQAVGAVPTPSEPVATQDAEAWLGWLDAVRTVSIMVLRPLQDRDLERLVRVPGEAEGPRTLKRLLAELLYLQGSLRGGLEPRP